MNEKIVLKISAIMAGLSGILILSGVFFPIALHKITADQKFPTLLSPLVETSSGEKLDYTKASNWFTGGVNEDQFNVPSVGFFTLTIPKLKIQNATVAIGGEDLSKSLVQYPGTALPGRNGNAVIFGHSILPIFYNPKDYMAVFSTLSTLEKGDEIYINYDGIAFKYRVETMVEAYPTDLTVLAQDKTDSFISLVTCTPPGDPRKPKRLVVKARVVPFLGENNVESGNENSWN